MALHDIGKLSRPFQAQAPEHWPTAALGALTGQNKPPPGPRHDALGAYLLRDVLAEQLNEVLPPREGSRRRWIDSHRGHLFRALAGHHGRPPQEPEVTPGRNVLCESCLAAAHDFVDVMREVFRPSPLMRPMEQRDVARLGWHLAGLVTLADWVGSRQAWFPYVASEAVTDPSAYLWRHALPRAAMALAASGLAPAAPSPFTGLRGLFPRISPSPAQRWAETVTLPPGPVLAVIANSDGKRPVIPTEGGHRFRSKPATP